MSELIGLGLIFGGLALVTWVLHLRHREKRFQEELDAYQREG